jgi:large subunit ribosomal protein L24
MRIKVGDEVEVVSGNYKGTRGTVQRVLPKANRVVVSGVNLVKKHQRPRPTSGRTQAQGGIIEFEAPISASNVMLVCPESGKPTRVGVRRDENGNRLRISKKSGNPIS